MNKIYSAGTRIVFGKKSVSEHTSEDGKRTVTRLGVFVYPVAEVPVGGSMIVAAKATDVLEKLAGKCLRLKAGNVLISTVPNLTYDGKDPTSPAEFTNVSIVTDSASKLELEDCAHPTDGAEIASALGL